MNDFKRLKVWQEAHRLTLSIYEATGAFPLSEQYGLTSQMRRAAASIPANIAEGYGRGGDAELARFLRIAAGSANELEYHLLLARDLTLLGAPAHDRLISQLADVRRMLTGFLQRLKTDRTLPQAQEGVR